MQGKHEDSPAPTGHCPERDVPAPYHTQRDRQAQAAGLDRASRLRENLLEHILKGRQGQVSSTHHTHLLWQKWF